MDSAAAWHIYLMEQSLHNMISNCMLTLQQPEKLFGLV
jgi:hypothetical protein